MRGKKGEGQQQVAEVISLPYVGTPANIYIDISNASVQHVFVRVLRGRLHFQVTKGQLCSHLFGDPLVACWQLCVHESEGKSEK